MGIISAIKIIHEMNEADKNNERADRMTVKAANTLYAAQAAERSISEKYRNSTAKVANRKRAILEKSFPRFKATYDNIMQIQFNQDTRGIKELFSIKNMDGFQTYMGDMLTYNPKVLTDKQLTSSVYTEGGKALLLSALDPIKGFDPVGAFFVGISASIRKESELTVANASAQKKQANLYSEAVEAKADSIDAVCAHMENISAILAKLNAFFLKSIKMTDEIISRNGYDSGNYSDKELEYLGICMNLAAAIKNVVDAPILDENDKVTQIAASIIVTGQEYISKFEGFL